MRLAWIVLILASSLFATPVRLPSPFVSPAERLDEELVRVDASIPSLLTREVNVTSGVIVDPDRATIEVSLPVLESAASQVLIDETDDDLEATPQLESPQNLGNPVIPGVVASIAVMLGALGLALRKVPEEF